MAAAATLTLCPAGALAATGTNLVIDADTNEAEMISEEIDEETTAQINEEYRAQEAEEEQQREEAAQQEAEERAEAWRQEQAQESQHTAVATETSESTAGTVPANPFRDIQSSDWFYRYVLDVYSKGLMSGTSDTEFAPSATLTRGMVASILYRMEGNPAVTVSNTFTDLSDGQWYTNGVLWAAQERILSGYGDGRCGPNDAVTVEQLSSILYRYAGSPTVRVSLQDLSGYTGKEAVSEYAQNAVAWAAQQGMLHGTDLHPTVAATRAEAAQMFSLMNERTV